MMNKNCPVCGNNETTPTIFRERIPILQNRVYKTKIEATTSPSGRLTLCTCSKCGFSYNGEFDENLITYDKNYDNDVPSMTFEGYTQSIARFLIEKYNLTTGTVYDIGCGKGTFLRTFCRLAPGIKGVGIDPSCEPMIENNFELVRDIFRPGSFGAETKLIILRHVLEHIKNPVDFLTKLGEAGPSTPLYVEVPEVNWIFESGAFWDFCYEHCNYFSATSLKNTMLLAGFTDIEQSSSFGGQYQWAIGVVDGKKTNLVSDPVSAVSTARAYAALERASIERVRKLLRNSVSAAIWGMSTKGVMLSCLVGGSVGIDINTKKQGKFAPLSGVKIEPPQWLKENAVDTVLIMNGNYEVEIRKQIAEMGVKTTIVVM